jgi:hypothetical protein
VIARHLPPPETLVDLCISIFKRSSSLRRYVRFGRGGGATTDGTRAVWRYSVPYRALTAYV